MLDKACHRCKQWKAVAEFSKDSTKRDGYRTICKDCTAIGNQSWRGRNLEINKQKKRDYYYQNRQRILKERSIARNGARYLARLKQEVYNHYGNKCYCCGLDDPRFLTVEHLNNDGHAVKHKGGKRVSGSTMYRCIIDTGFPDDIALACFNCNCARAHHHKGGACPHQVPLPPDYDKSRYFIDFVEAKLQAGVYDLPVWTPEDVRRAENLPVSKPPKQRAKRKRLASVAKQKHLF